MFFFFRSTRTGEHVLSAATSERRMYWLQQLQKARRDFAATNRNSLNAQVGHEHQKNVGRNCFSFCV